MNLFRRQHFCTIPYGVFALLHFALHLILAFEVAVGAVPVFREAGFSEGQQFDQINDLYQDQKGFLWLGTSAGLYQTDGLQSTRVAGTDSLEITTIMSTGSGVLHAGTSDGKFIRIDDRSMTFQIVWQNPLQNAITGIVEDPSGKVWLSTYGNGCFFLENDQMQNVDVDSSVNSLEIYTMIADSEGRIWMGTDYGILICSWKNGKSNVTHVNTRHGLPDNIVRALAKDALGNIWIGMHRGGVCRYDVAQDAIDMHTVMDNWDHGQVNAIAVVDGRHIWIGTDGDGVAEIELFSSKPTHYRIQGTPGKRIRVFDVMIDDEGNGWVSDNENGLILASTAIGFLQGSGSFSNENIQALAVDGEQDIWYSTSDGLWEYQHNTGASTRHLSSEKLGINVISLFVDIIDRVWVGTFGQGLYLYDPSIRRFEHFTEKDGLTNNNVLSIDGNNDFVWFATLGGVSKTSLLGKQRAKDSKPTFVSYHDEHGLGTEYIYQCYPDSKGRVWFATDGKGITVLENENFTNYSGDDFVGNGVVYSIAEDPSGRLWFGSAREGVFCYDGQSFSRYSEREGLRAKSITALAAAENGNIVVVHQDGLDILDSENRSLRYFGHESGIGNIDPDLNVISNDSLGNIWIGTNSGLFCYRASNHKFRCVPKLMIHNVLVFMEPFRGSTYGHFDYDENHLTFPFTGLWYSDPDGVIYQYRLLGVDPNWITSRDHFASYSNLEPGKYIFQVRASLDAQFDNDVISEISFHINNPFWHSVWFYLAASLTAIFLIALVVQLRERKTRRSQLIEKEKFTYQIESLRSQVNPHFLFNSFNTLISLIEEDPRRAMDFTDKLSDYFRNILLMRDRELITLREELVLVLDYYHLLKTRYGENFKMDITIPDPYLDTHIPPLTLQMLAENALKHNIASGSKPLYFSIFVEAGSIRVRNNIQLKRQPESSTGVGLKNIMNQYTIIAGQDIAVEKADNYFSVILPIIDHMP